MRINTSDNVPDSTYFTLSDVEPTIEDDGSITIYDGRGTQRSSWGAPATTSTIVLDECDFAAIHVGFHHKHRGGQGWFYYTTDGIYTRRIKWQQLPDELRQRVQNATDNAPSWAKFPGSLRTAQAKPTTTKRTAYKLVEINGDKLISLYDGRTEYQLGQRLAQANKSTMTATAWIGSDAEGYWVSQPTHNGGFYSHPTADQVLRLWESGNLVPGRCKRSAKRLALLECEISGKISIYANGKMASTYLTPKSVISEFDFQPE